MFNRIEMNFNPEWKFKAGDEPLAWRADFDDSAFRPLDLPHDFSIEGEFSENYASGTGYLPGGYGWYRKHFDFDSSLENKKVFIRFNGVYNNSQVWVNGNYLGKRPYGYSSFTYDITDYVKQNGNVIAVKADHSKNADSRWYTGSGIYRDVTLIVTSRIYINEYAPFVSTVRADQTKAVIKIENELVNETGKEEDVTVIFSVKDQSGSIIQESLRAKPGITRFTREITIEKPLLWSVETPNLYELSTVVFIGNRMTDDTKTVFGIRTIAFTPNEGFFLNGVNMKIKGVCVHHDAGCLGAAVPAKVWERRLKILKEMGCNAVRMSHNPPDPLLLDLCDRMGFLVMDEAFDEWEGGKNKWVHGRDVGLPVNDGYYEDFPQWANIDLRDMVLRDRNHPSIIMWSIGNEIDFRNDPYTHEVLGEHYRKSAPHASRLGVIAKQLVKTVKEYDATRPVTAALATATVANTVGFSDALDVVGYNYQENLYEEDHKKYPNRVLYGSENGKQTEAWLAVKDNPYICAQFIWTGIDFLGEAGAWPNRNSQAGFLDLAGFKKPLYFQRQSLWSDEPVIYLATALEGERLRFKPSWNYENGQTVTVHCYTNEKQAELFLNGKSLGVKEGDFTWKVPFEAGTLSAKSGKLTCELKTAGKPKKIVLIKDKETYMTDDALTHVEVHIVDEAGTLVYDAENRITVHLTGGTLLGIENGNASSHEKYQQNTLSVFHGKALIYIRPAEKTVLTVVSEGLEEAVLE